MKTAVFLYNTQSGRGHIDRNVENICTVFQAYGYDVTPQLIDFDANPFDGNEGIDLMVVAGGDGTVNFAVNAMKRKGLNIPLGGFRPARPTTSPGRSACRQTRSRRRARSPQDRRSGWTAAA